jgi:hypothetical protein
MSGEPDFLSEVEMQLGSDWKSPMDKRNEEIEKSLSVLLCILQKLIFL